jgi:hypothetical protein
MEQAGYRVRVCFELSTIRALTGLETPVEMELAGTAGTWLLEEVSAPTMIRGQILALKSPTVDSHDAAEHLGWRAAGALMMVGLKEGYGCMLTDRRAGVVRRQGPGELRGESFDGVLTDVLGITVFPGNARVGFWRLEGVADFRNNTSAERMFAQLAEVFAHAPEPPSAVTTAFDLWSAALSESSSRVRLLLLVMAVEALSKEKSREKTELDLRQR